MLHSPAPIPVAPLDRSWSILAAVLETLETADIPYCITHGYEDLAQGVTSDVDCIVPIDVSPERLTNLLKHHRRAIGADVIRCLSGHIVLAGRNADRSPCFVDLHVGNGYELNGHRYYSAEQILGRRRRFGELWIPAVRLAFGCHLVRRVIKGSISDDNARRFGDLYRQDPRGCAAEISRFWSPATAAEIRSAIERGDWKGVQNGLPRFRSELQRRTALRRPLEPVRDQFTRLARRGSRICWPKGGMEVIFLGPDGAGKSSVISQIGKELDGAFSSTRCLFFPPALYRRWRGRPEGPPVLPHDLPQRSVFASVSRALAYWLAYYIAGYWISIRPALARSALVIHDRHLLDALVDPRRYRYAGPAWLLRWIWLLLPKPDLVILLDAPADVLHARKQELPFEQTVELMNRYRQLVRTLRNGYAVDASLPLRDVTAAVNDIILGTLSRRFDAEEPRPDVQR
ncbi:hypothetical protein J6500_08975 [Bradyrhizobium sp. WSM 1704]|uniref:hypothetical protein n=1 Tax=Bradyrhizobium semiaridum TaxID=2821404 RepID=UPI001CE35908|nr:hypothetical protein [Bradyrhizobium semiaridum]MCA6122029.1 hypothetical protein [Bradyrhizobium semiaridum]